MKTTVSSKGQIVLPAELRQRDRIEAGQEFEVERLDRGDYRLVGRSLRPNDGVVDWLLACPGKGFFREVEPPGKIARIGEGHACQGQPHCRDGAEA